jgi:D-alanyl-lipoteichoic acid acyltransferase DltB (MBOAT superfamily)
VSYFPLLVALFEESCIYCLKLGQRTFDYEESQTSAVSIYMGLVKKMVIADTCATYANLTIIPI